MMNALKFGISILSLAAVCLAQDGLTIDNKHKERVSAPEVEKITPRRVRSSSGNSTSGTRSIPRSELFWVPTRTRYVVCGTRSRAYRVGRIGVRKSCGWLLRI
jgi:hypothetical protein